MNNTVKKVFRVFFFAACLWGRATASHALEWVDNTVTALEENLDKGSAAGVGLLYSASPYKKMDDIILPVPILQLGYKQFFIDQQIVGYNFINSDEFKVGVVAGPHLGGYDASKSDFLEGMQDRDWGFDAGVRVKWENEVVDVTATGVSDISGTYEGQQISLFLSKKLWDGFLTPRLGATWLSHDNVDYYYGVQSSEATAQRPAYSPNSAVDYTAGLTIAVPLGEKWAAVLDTQYEMFSDQIKDSPIVNADGVLRVVLGTVYRF